jgi:dihydropyrimidinase
VDYARQYPGVPLDEALAYWRGLAEPKAVIDFGFHLMPVDADPERTLRPIADLVAQGVTTFKIFMMRHSDRDILALMRRIAECGAMAMMHCESAAIDADAYGQLAAAGQRSARSWAKSRPLASEFEAVSRAIDYARYTGCPIYLVHISSAEAIRRIRLAKQLPELAWVETRPCYLLFTEERYADESAGYLGYTGYPPLRGAADVETLWSAVADGTVEIIGSDHAAWTIEQKLAAADDLVNLPIGLPSLETQSRALYTAGVGTGRIDVCRFVALTSTNPAVALGLYPRKGTIAAGSDADITLWDPHRTDIIRAADMHGGVDYEPCDGMECTGWPVRTISRGETIVLDGRFVGNAGRGQFLARS